MKDADSGNGNVFVVSRAEFRGEAVVLKRWHGAVVQEKFRILFTEVRPPLGLIPPSIN
jgi:hypothetical protein